MNKIGRWLLVCKREIIPMSGCFSVATRNYPIFTTLIITNKISVYDVRSASVVSGASLATKIFLTCESD